MFKTEASPAPRNPLIVAPRLFMDMKRANKVPSMPGGHRWPDNIRKGMNLQVNERVCKRSYILNLKGQINRLDFMTILDTFF